MPQRNIPILRIPFTREDYDYLHQGVEEVLGSGLLTLGKYTREFESAFGEFTGAKHCVTVNSCTAALEIIVRALGIAGASVIVPTNTFPATALAAMHAGNRVIFADSDPETLCLDVADVERRIEEDTWAVILVHIGGNITPQYYQLKALCEARNLYLVEDCAHSPGSTIDGQSSGILGIAGAFSFFPTKPLTTGEGGMVTTNDDSVYEQATMIRNQGKNPALGNHISEIGHNFRMNEITALMGVQQMRRAPEVLEDRRRIARFYDSALHGFRGLRPITIAPNTVSSYYKYIAYLDPVYERSAVKGIMREKYGVSLPGEVYADLCHDEPIWERYTYCGKRRSDSGPVQCTKWPDCGCEKPQKGFPGAEYISKHHVCLPLYPGLTEEELLYVVESLDRTLHEDLEPN